MNRRGFLQGFAALAACAVAPTIPAALVQTEVDRLMAKIATGLVEGETFYLEGGIVLDGIRNLTINRCHFYMIGKPSNEPMITVSKNCDGLTITNCTFNSHTLLTRSI